MLVLIHVIIAFVSLGYTGFMYFNPSRARLRVSYSLVAATLGSGTILIATSRGHMLEACMMGFFYLGLVTLGIVSAKHKLADEKIHDK